MCSDGCMFVYIYVCMLDIVRVYAEGNNQDVELG